MTYYAMLLIVLYNLYSVLLRYRTLHSASMLRAALALLSGVLAVDGQGYEGIGLLQALPKGLQVNF